MSSLTTFAQALGGVASMTRITVVYDPPPIPLRTMDYVAYEDEHSARGATAGEAVECLLELLMEFLPQDHFIEIVLKPN